MSRNLTYFASDVHLGLQVADPAGREARFVSFLKRIPAAETDALYLLRETSHLGDAELAGLKDWYSKFADWMSTSDIGRDEARQHNNHGVAYDLQLATYLHLSGRDEDARKVLADVLAKRIATQIEPDGRLPHELARTRSASYATMNAMLFAELALLGERLGVDIWHAATADGRSVKKAVEWLMPYWRGEKEWVLQQITSDDWAKVGRDVLAIYGHFEGQSPR